MRVRLVAWFVIVSITSLMAAVSSVCAEDLGYGEGLAEALMAAENEEATGGEPVPAVKVQTIAGSADRQDTAASERLPGAVQRAVSDSQAE